MLENWASWVTNWVSSMGFMKSWLVIWATIRDRKSSTLTEFSFLSVNTASQI